MKKDLEERKKVINDK